MPDIFENTILCENCNKKTSKSYTYKDGFKIRNWYCENCNKKWYHPLDLKEYEDFNKLKNKSFEVKLRLIGNSFCVSIPREIIEFEKEMQQETNKIISMSLEEPQKLSLFFRRRIRKIY